MAEGMGCLQSGKGSISGRVTRNGNVLLIDSWRDQEALDVHHASPMMAKISVLREKYDLHMKVERYISDDRPADEAFIRK